MFEVSILPFSDKQVWPSKYIRMILPWCNMLQVLFVLWLSSLQGNSCIMRAASAIEAYCIEWKCMPVQCYDLALIHCICLMLQLLWLCCPYHQCISKELKSNGKLINLKSSMQCFWSAVCTSNMCMEPLGVHYVYLGHSLFLMLLISNPASAWVQFPVFDWCLLVIQLYFFSDGIFPVLRYCSIVLSCWLCYIGAFNSISVLDWGIFTDIQVTNFHFHYISCYALPQDIFFYCICIFL